MSKQRKMVAEPKALLRENLLLDAHLVLREASDLKRKFSIELRAIRDDKRAQQGEFQEFSTELREVLHQIQAKDSIQAQLFDLIQPRRKSEHHARY